MIIHPHNSVLFMDGDSTLAVLCHEAEDTIRLATISRDDAGRGEVVESTLLDYHEAVGLRDALRRVEPSENDPWRDAGESVKVDTGASGRRYVTMTSGDEVLDGTYLTINEAHRLANKLDIWLSTQHEKDSE